MKESRLIESPILDKVAKEFKEKHIYKEGSRDHVLSWSTNGQHCSNPNCEINKP